MSFVISRQITEIAKLASELKICLGFYQKVTTVPSQIAKFQQQSMPYYAVAAGWEVGIFDTWGICESKVKGFSNPKYKKFKTRQEAEAFLETNGVDVTSPKKVFDPKIDAVPIRSVTTSKSLPFTHPVAENPIKTNIKDEPLPEIEDNWPDDVDWNETDDDVLLAAAAEVEGISESSRKRKLPPDVSGGGSSKILKKYQHDSKIWEPIGLKKIGNFEFPIDSEGYVIVYTDGSCINNGKANAVAGFGVYFSEGHSLNAAKPVEGRVTNNAGEIQAAIYAIRVAKDFGIRKLCLSTDSQFVINAATAWIKGWKRRGWTVKGGQPVKNVDDFKILDKLLDGSVDIKWNYVKGHKGIIGNEKADQLARKGSDLYRERMKK